MACFKGFGPLNVIPGASPHRHSRVATFGYQGQMTERSALKAYEDDCESRSANQSDVAGESRDPSRSRSRSRSLSLTPFFPWGLSIARSLARVDNGPLSQSRRDLSFSPIYDALLRSWFYFWRHPVHTYASWSTSY